MKQEAQRGLRGFLVLALTAVAMSLLFVACGSSDSDSSSESTAGGTETSASGSGNASIDLGDQTIEVAEGTPKIGFFGFGLSAYELAYADEIEKMNEEGSDVTFVEAKFDPAVQLKQLQTALTTDEYDAWILEPVDAEGVCQIASKQAPEAGIPVSIVVNPTCDRALEPWDEAVWAPGTLNMVSSVANVTFFTNVLNAQKEVLEIGPDTKVGVINGPDIVAQANAYKAALENAGIEPVEIAKGDYTAPTAQKLTQAMLSRHPDIEVLLNGFEGATPGMIAALKQAGKGPGEVKVGDIGGSKEISIPNLESGWLTVTAAEGPRTAARQAIEEVERAFAGEQGGRLFSADPPGATLEKPLLVTKENAKTFKPEF
ncbi:MAG: sugar ABC transporter substrate-binding protein [Solirubrobacterales bacterium]